MNFPWRRTGIFGGLLIAAVGFYLLPEMLSLPEEEGTITEFHGHEWGTPRNVIVSNLGSRGDTRHDSSVDSRSSESPRKRRLVYPQQSVQGETVTASFLLYPERRLVQGLYSIPFERENDCRDLFAKFRTYYQQKFSSLEPEDGRFNNIRVKFCYAVRVGQAGRFVQWRDKRGNRVTLLMGYGLSRPNLKVIFESGELKEEDRFLSRLDTR